MNKLEFVYFVRAGNLLKIGRSKNPFKRMGALSRDVNHKCEFLFALRYPYAKVGERLMHNKFSKYRVFGEWFTFNASKIAMLKIEYFRCILYKKRVKELLIARAEE